MFTIMGIDPGTRFLGVSALRVNTRRPEPFEVTYADTLRGDLNDFVVDGLVVNHTRTKGLVRSYRYLMDYLTPGMVFCEDNFLELNPASFKRLIEMVTLMGVETNINYPSIPFNLVLPRLAKQIVLADFENSTKDDVMNGLLRCSFINFNGFNPAMLSDNTNDAMLVALYGAVQLYLSYGWINKDPITKKYSLIELAPERCNRKKKISKQKLIAA